MVLVCQLAHRIVNIFFMLVIVKDQSTDFWGIWLLQNNFMNTYLRDQILVLGPNSPFLDVGLTLTARRIRIAGKCWPKSLVPKPTFGSRGKSRIGLTVGVGGLSGIFGSGFMVQGSGIRSFISVDWCLLKTKALDWRQSSSIFELCTVMSRHVDDMFVLGKVWGFTQSHAPYNVHLTECTYWLVLEIRLPTQPLSQYFRQ